MLQCDFQKYVLKFRKPGGTSRGVLREKETWIISLFEQGQKEKVAYGECGLFRGLSAEDHAEYEEKLAQVCKELPVKKEAVLKELVEWPSIYFGVEMLLKDWNNKSKRILFKSPFTEGQKGMAINGLVWMGSQAFMLDQVEEKLKEGFNCLKLKIGAIDFESELEILSLIRKRFSAEEIELRVDANGAFAFNKALEKLKRLSEYDLHSIEQPIGAGQVHEMAELVAKSPIPIALDEELIGINKPESKRRLLEIIRPDYIILKPTLVGGFAGSLQWIQYIEEQGGGWWITSALESNIGLNALAQFTYTLNNSLPQGLGTGQLYTNNFSSPLMVQNGRLFYRKEKEWDMNLLKQ